MRKMQSATTGIRQQAYRRCLASSMASQNFSRIHFQPSMRFRRNDRPFRTSTRWSHRESSIKAAPAAAAQLAVFDSIDDHETNILEDYDSTELSTHRHMSSHIFSQTMRELSSLDLELGESPIEEEEEEEDNDEFLDYEGIIEEEASLASEFLDYDDVTEEASLTSEYLDVPEVSLHSTTKNKRKLTAREILRAFDPEDPPDSDDPEDIQLWLECKAQREGVLKYQRVLDDARNRKDFASMSVFQKQVIQWFPNVRDEVARMQSEYMVKQHGETKKSTKRYGPFLCTLTPEKLAVIAAHETLLLCLLRPGKNGNPGVPFVTVARRLGEAVEQEVLVHRMLHKRSMERSERLKKLMESKETDSEDVSDLLEAPEEQKYTVENQAEESDPKVDGAPANWTYALSHLNNYLEELSRNDISVKKRRVIRYAIRRARLALEKEAWSDADRIGLGAALFHCLLENSPFRIDGCDIPAFSYEKRWIGKGKIQAVVILNESLMDHFLADNVSGLSAMTTRYKPMILPPKPWKNTEEGGYLWLKSEMMRYHGCNMQKEALETADMSILHQGLNVLGQVPWKINQRILEVAWQCWEQDIALGDIPTRTDNDVPPEPIPPPRMPDGFDKDSPAYQQMQEERKSYRDALTKYRRVRQKNMDLRSLRCSAILKLDQAETFKHFDKIYFPYNIDFRGRAYPIPPHLSNVGSDLSRGLLAFAEAKPLGERGLFWLKVHLANLAGMDKMTFEDRAGFVDKNFEKVRQSAEDPFAGDRWWMGLDDPFQGLSACIEIVNAVDSGDPESYMCHLPVHMDGSCNGLQHYAALGRDRIGGKAVNLCSDKEPQDVYIGVMHEVVRRVAEEAARNLDFETSDVSSLSKEQKEELARNRAAKLVDGLIDRGVVKRTVMTSVYGVTYIGARNQIHEKIESKLADAGYDVDEIENEVFKACGYLASITMQAVGELFVGAKETMDWLTTCARMITQHGYPVAWISPIGIPAIQPYRQKKSSTIVTLMQTVTLTDEHDDLPLHKTRQVSAFPPNYVHSLDSSHMLLTALEMDRRRLSFSAVHDSFWTHACNIDEMNDALRVVFIELYSQPLLEQLKKSWEMRYPDLNFPDLPERGDLILTEVRDAPYFFQ